MVISPQDGSFARGTYEGSHDGSNLNGSGKILLKANLAFNGSLGRAVRSKSAYRDAGRVTQNVVDRNNLN